MTIRTVALCCITLLTISLPVDAAGHLRQYENVLGTSFELQLDCEADVIDKFEKVALDEIDRLTQILSHYQSDSEISRLLHQVQTGNRRTVSLPLFQVLSHAESLREATGGAFDVRAGELARLWENASGDGKVPTESQRRLLTEKLGQAPYVLEASSLTRADSLTWSLDGIAKGFILDAVAKKLLSAAPDLQGWINIGGDIRTLGNKPTSIQIEDPTNAAVNAQPISEIRVPAGWAVCTSGSYRRGSNVDGQRYSHIIDPRSGLPTDHVLSASVMSQSAAVADGLATALSVLSPSESLTMIEELEATECLLVLADGRQVASEGWPQRAVHRFISDEEQEGAAEPKKADDGLIVDFTLDRPKGSRYRRPYVAVWLEDKDGFPVKTAILWMQTEQPGPRWYRDLTRWYRNDRMRKTVEKNKLIGTISGATRGAGEYQAVFDGTDNAGKELPSATYTLCLEVAREHGTYQLIREKVELNGVAIKKTDLKGNVEMGKVSYRYLPVVAAKVQ